MNWKSALVLCIAIWLGYITGCDRRSSTSRSRNEISFSTELSLIKDYSTGRNRADIQFFREGVAFSEALIKVDGIIIPNAGGSIYFDTLFAPLNTGLVYITFESEADLYADTLILDLPDSFGIDIVSPPRMDEARDVYIEWSAAGGATAYILGVSTVDAPYDGSNPFSILLSGSARHYTVSDSVFLDGAGYEVFGTYYIYLIAFNGGFMPYVGLRFPLPEDVPVRPLAGPSGTAGYGTIAPIDSVSVDSI
ncbi:MAG: hypothetical protein JSW64_06040 [Candidatus Zixiibacteriota bacterium]|nr:MAG: hypothetical protein JSW64_06040 [candidate division Zixibacteria bacterium]